MGLGNWFGQDTKEPSGKIESLSVNARKLLIEAERELKSGVGQIPDFTFNEADDQDFNDYVRAKGEKKPTLELAKSYLQAAYDRRKQGIASVTNKRFD